MHKRLGYSEHERGPYGRIGGRWREQRSKLAANLHIALSQAEDWEGERRARKGRSSGYEASWVQEITPSDAGLARVEMETPHGRHSRKERWR